MRKTIENKEKVVTNEEKVASGQEKVVSVQEKVVNDKEFTCEKCEKVLSCKRNLERHMKTCSGVGSLQCPICKISFNTRQSKCYHMKKNNCSPTEEKCCSKIPKSPSLLFFLSRRQMVPRGL